VAARKRTLGTREDEMRRLKAEIDELGGRIDTLRSTQTALRASGDTRTYNANVPVVNGLINQYNDDVDVLNTRIDEYNSLLGA
jgi:predicted  nucleic acid-binding Zn-ribbon protein